MLNDENGCDLNANQKQIIIKGCLQIHKWFFVDQNSQEIIRNLASLTIHPANDIERMLNNFTSLLTDTALLNRIYYTKSFLSDHFPALSEIKNISTNWIEEGALFVLLEESLSLIELLQHAHTNKMITFEHFQDEGIMKGVFIGLEIMKRQFYNERSLQEPINLTR